MSAIAASRCAFARTASSSKARSRSRIARVRWSTVNTLKGGAGTAERGRVVGAGAEGSGGRKE